MSLHSLLAPLTEEQFFGGVWERREHYYQSDDRGRFNQYLSIEDVDWYLSQNDLRYPCLRLAKDGKELPLADFSTLLRFGDYSAHGLIQPDRVVDCYRRGATIVIQMAHTSLPKLSRLAVDLEKDLNFNVQMTIYLTPPNSQGFTAHYDTHNVIVIQLSGSKAWRVYDFEKRAPLLSDTFNQTTFVPHIGGRNYDLTPGSFLYIPRGMVHEAAANAAPSLHVTIGLFPPLWIDLFFSHLKTMERDEDFRLSPYWSQGFPQGQLAIRNHLKKLLQSFCDSFDFSMLMENQIANSIKGQIQNNENRLLDVLALPNITSRTRFRVRSHLRLRLVERDKQIIIRCFDKELKFNTRFKSVIESIIQMPDAFNASELSVPLDETSKLTLCTKLTQEGILTIIS